MYRQVKNGFLIRFTLNCHYLQYKSTIFTWSDCTASFCGKSAFPVWSIPLKSALPFFPFQFISKKNNKKMKVH